MPYLGRVEATPTAPVPKRGPDLTPTGKTRTISDMGGINLSPTKYDVYAVTVPQIQVIAEKIIELDKFCPRIKIDTCKRNIDSAPKRVMLHPDVAAVACREFEKSRIATADGLLVGFLFLPFGFSGSPGLFQVTTDAIRAIHAATGSK